MSTTFYLVNPLTGHVLDADKADWLSEVLGQRLANGNAVVVAFENDRQGRPATGWRDGGLTHAAVAAWVEEHGPVEVMTIEHPFALDWEDEDGNLRAGWTAWGFVGEPLRIVVEERGPDEPRLLPLAAALPAFRWLHHPEKDTFIVLHGSGLWLELDTWGAARVPREHVAAIASAIHRAVLIDGAAGQHDLVIGHAAGQVVEVRLERRAPYLRVVPGTPDEVKAGPARLFLPATPVLKLLDDIEYRLRQVDPRYPEQTCRLDDLLERIAAVREEFR